MNNTTPKPIGWATTIKTITSIPREMWDSVMTVEKSQHGRYTVVNKTNIGVRL